MIQSKDYIASLQLSVLSLTVSARASVKLALRICSGQSLYIQELYAHCIKWVTPIYGETFLSCNCKSQNKQINKCQSHTFA